MKASPVEGIGHEGEGDQVHSQAVIIQVQGLLGTWNIKAWFQRWPTQCSWRRQTDTCLNLRSRPGGWPCFQPSGWGSRRPWIWLAANLLRGGEAPDIGPGSGRLHTDCRVVTEAHPRLLDSGIHHLNTVRKWALTVTLTGKLLTWLQKWQSRHWWSVLVL